MKSDSSVPRAEVERTPVQELQRIVDIIGFFFEGSSTHPNSNSLLHAIVQISEDAIAKAQGR